MKIGRGIEEEGSINALNEKDAAEEFSSRESVQRSTQKWIHLNIRLLHMRTFSLRAGTCRKPGWVVRYLEKLLTYDAIIISKSLNFLTLKRKSSFTAAYVKWCKCQVV